MAHPPPARSKYPRSPIAGPYGHPFHPIAIIIPIGAWVAAIIFDILALTGDDASAFAVGARILIIIGLIGSVAAALLGVIDWFGLPPGTTARATGTTHMVLNLAVMCLFLVSLLLRDSDDVVPMMAFLASVAGIVLLAASGWLGGKLAHTFGVRVADERTQAEGYEPLP
ncbi:hypothetical protein CVS47_00681 [Microbacterium lemovicicum]|uniref:DUF2231 domain-containing protein n=1 Tax=Microbacterium lemovicicum TaxID=1072463 RepID=A0A3S9W7M2_9MICO|nr:DUF2231 domain-containing protein [Microbacterium lemovicicum]AZS36082.1 hypothetical protein CVS47_00681 [Microbacterium lemovicicum]